MKENESIEKYEIVDYQYSKSIIYK